MKRSISRWLPLVWAGLIFSPAHANTDDIKHAQECLREAERTGKSTDSSSMYWNLVRLSDAYRQDGNFAQSERTFLKLIDLQRKAKNQQVAVPQAMVDWGTAAIYCTHEDPKAAEWTQKGLALFDKLPNSFGEKAAAHASAARSYVMPEQLGLAKAEETKLESILRERKCVFDSGHLELDTALNRLANKPGASKPEQQKWLVYAKRVSDGLPETDRTRIRAHQTLLQFYQDNGKPAEALQEMIEIAKMRRTLDPAAIFPPPPCGGCGMG